MEIAVVGLGLIGGSLARTIKAKSNHRVAGFDLNRPVMEAALEDGAIDRIASSFSGFDLVLVALYPGDTLTFLREHVGEFSPGALVMDCCGVKEYICSQAVEIFRESDAAFLGGHPMAGREFSGYDHSLSTLFAGASMILTPLEETPPERVAFAEEFFMMLGFGRTTVTTPQHHDQVIAYTSQLAHVVSSAYMLSPTAQEFMGFSAGSFADLTRVAKLNAGMWSELFLCNRTALGQEIERLIEKLEAFREAIGEGEATLLREMLQRGSDTKESLTNKR